ncbi:MAG: HAD family phosphatase [Saprospiraceae bacterium]|nr:HAD family phosphatase [Saprospiraceae bacterium]
MEQKVNTIIWDLGGVLIDWDPRYLYRKIFRTNHAMEYFLHHICTPEWNEEQDGGRSFEDATTMLINLYPEYNSEIKAYYNRWTEMLSGEIDASVEILTMLKESEKYRLLALTNWSAESFPIALERFEFLGWFEGILVSGAEGLKKPDPAIYELLFSRYNVDRSKALFIDDNLRNVVAAKNVGLHTIHFTGAAQCEQELKMFI